MKQLWVGVLGAVIGGFILFLLQQVCQGWNEQGKYRIEFDKASEITARVSDLDSIKSKLSATYDNQMRIYLVTAKNTGERDLSNVTFSYPACGIVLIKNESLPNDNPDNVIINKKDDLLTLKYKFLPTGGSHKFWYATTSVFSMNKFSAESSGIEVINSDSFDYAGFPWVWFVYFIIAVIIFLGGAAVGSEALVQQLKAHGVDAKSILKPKKESVPD